MSETPTPARASATVVLVRAGTGAPEVLMVQRHHQAAFGSVHAFPGGVVDEVDRQVQSFCRGVTAAQANRRLNLKEGALAYYSAVIRELFEETGVLLARRAGADSGTLEGTEMAGEREAARDSLAAGPSAWPGILQRLDLILAADALHYIAHWVTPVDRRRRYSARFFLALCPAGQTAVHDGRELVDSRWLTPARVLELAAAGEIELAFPTARNLETLAGFENLGTMQSWAADRWRAGVPRVQPVMIGQGDAARFVIPGDSGYPAAPS